MTRNVAIRALVYGALLVAMVAAGALWMKNRKGEGDYGPVIHTGSAKTPASARIELPPDGRMLLAVDELERIVRGQVAAPATATFETGAWRIHAGAEDRGILPANPEFADAWALLVERARALGAPDSLRGAAAPELITQARSLDRELLALDAVNAIDAAWKSGVRDPALALVAAQALTLLCVQTPSFVDAHDRLSARALAWAAVAATLDSASSIRNQCLLADHMGYAAFARARAPWLAPADPARAFLLHEDATLAAMSGKSGSPEARYFGLLRLAHRGRLDAWRAWRDLWFAGDSGLAIRSAQLQLPVFASRPFSAAKMIDRIATELRLLGGNQANPALADSAALSQVITGFEGVMASMPDIGDGAILDRELIAQYFRENFYSALWVYGDHVRKQLSTIEGTKAFAAALGGVPTGPASDFARRLEHLAAAKNGTPPKGELIKDLTEASVFGAPVRLAAYDALRAAFSVFDLTFLKIPPRLARALDSRPSHRRTLSRVVLDDLLDMEWGSELLESAAHTLGEGDPWLSAWAACYRGDAAGAESLLVHPDLEPRQRAQVIGTLLDSPQVKREELGRVLEVDVAKNPSEWALAADYIEFLEHEKRPDDAIAFLKSAIEGHRFPSENLADLAARAQWSRLLYDQGRFQEAWQAVEGVLGSYKFDVLERGALALDALGHTGEADTLAMIALKRYADSPSAIALVAEMSWRHGRDTLAAVILTQGPYAPEVVNWERHVAPRFVKCFKGRSREGLAACRAIVETGANPRLTVGVLAAAMAEAGDPAFAYEVFEPLRMPNPEGLSVMVQTYDFLRRAKGDAAATAWIRGRTRSLDAQTLGFLGAVAFEHGYYELLWSIDPPTGEIQEYWWLSRAAALHMKEALRASHQADVAAHYREGLKDRYHVFGRYLMGHATTAEVNAEIADGRSACEAYYFLGVKEQTQGNVREAAAYYQRCLQTQQSYNGEFRWAWAQLMRWRQKGRNAEQIAAELKGAGGSPVAAN